MICTGVQVLIDPPGDVLWAAPRHDGVHQAVTAPASQVVVVT